MTLLVPVDLAERVRATTAITPLTAVLARGATLLEHLDESGTELAVALGDTLFYRTRLALAHHDLRRLSEEVWDLEEAVSGTRDDQPPTALAQELVPLVSLEVGGDGDGDDGGDDDVLERLCYGLGSVAAEAAQRDGADPIGMIAQARSEFAAAKFALFESRHAEQVLGFRRAGLQGMHELAQHRRERRSPDASR